MKRQTLQFGGALLATTALSTAAMAGTVISTGANGTAVGTVLGANNLGAQVFPATTPETLVIGGSVAFAINFSNALTTTFDVEIESTNSDFNGTVGVTPKAQNGASPGSFATVETFSGCSVQVLTERILVDDCLSSSEAIDFLDVTGVAFNEANGLSSAGTSITVNGIVRGNSNNTFELISDGTITTSVNVASVTSSTPATVIINNNATPPFSGIGAANSTNQAATTVLGSVQITLAGAFEASLGSAISTGPEASNGAEFTITHGVLTDAAVTSVELQKANTASVVASLTASNFNGNVASFDVAPANVLNTFDIAVNFDGTTAIQTWAAGSIAVALSAGTKTVTAAPGATSALAALQRGGFSTQINTTQNTFGNGATLFQSLVRITNNGTVDGSVSITVRNDADGSVFGTFTTDVIEANSSIQVSMGDIETGLGITPTTNGQYQLGINGPIDGYAQHVMFNSVDNLFVDLSGFRNANP